MTDNDRPSTKTVFSKRISSLGALWEVKTFSVALMLRWVTRMQISEDHFSELMVASQPMLSRLARRLGNNAADSDDLVQETCYRALRHREGFVLREHGIGPWLAQILRNEHRAQGRARSRRPLPLHDMSSPTRGGSGAEWEGRPAGTDMGTLSIRDQLDDRMVQGLHNLDERFRQPLLMWAWDEMTFSEIAEHLGIPLGTVLSRLARGRAKLAEYLQPAVQEVA